MEEYSLLYIIRILPIIASIIAVYVRMNALVSKQEIRVQKLEEEIKERKRHNEKLEEKMYNKLDGIDDKISQFLVHFSRCINFKTSNNDK